jgi:fatty acid desaturase
MFGGIIVVVVHYACYAAVRKDRGARTRLAFVGAYLIIAAMMVLTLIVVAILQFSGNGLGLLVVEFIVIAEFAVFWLFQSIDLWELEKYQVPSLSQLLTGLAADTPARP